MKKKFGLLLTGAFVCLLSTAAIIYANVNLSGEWTLNASKSELGEFGERIAPKKLTIVGEVNAITINSVVPSFEGGENAITEKMSFDGKEIETVMYGNTKRKSSAKWSADGKIMNVNSVVLFDNNGQQVEIKVTEAYSLSDDGKTMTIKNSSTSQFGDNNMKLVYDKTK